MILAYKAALKRTLFLTVIYLPVQAQKDTIIMGVHCTCTYEYIHTQYTIPITKSNYERFNCNNSISG